VPPEKIFRRALSSSSRRGNCLPAGSATRGRLCPCPAAISHLGNLAHGLLQLGLQDQLSGWRVVCCASTISTRTRTAACLRSHRGRPGLWRRRLGRPPHERFFKSELPLALPYRGTGQVRLLRPALSLPLQPADARRSFQPPTGGNGPPYSSIAGRRSCRLGYQGWRQPSWRLRLAPGGLHCLNWLTRGWAGCPTAVGDVVLRRADGFSVLIHLATPVDEL